MGTTQVGNNPILIAAKGKTGIIYNRDNVNSVLWGLTASEANRADASILDPATGIVTDGSADVYAVSANNLATVLVDFIEGGQTRVPGILTATIASGTITVANASIAITAFNGFIPSGLTQQISQSGAQTITAGSQYVTPASGTTDVSMYNSIDVSCTASCSTQGSAGAPLTAQLAFTFYDDAAGTIPVGQETWTFWLANSGAGASPVFGSVVPRGHYMKVTVANTLPSTQSVQLANLVLFGSARTIPRSDLRQDPPTAITSGITLIQPGLLSVPSFGMLATAQSQSIPLNSTQWQPLGLMSGTAYMTFFQSAAMTHPPSWFAALNLTNPIGFSAPAIAANPNTAGTGSVSTPVALPRAPTYIICQTTAGAASTINFVGTVSED